MHSKIERSESTMSRLFGINYKIFIIGVSFPALTKKEKQVLLPAVKINVQHFLNHDKN